MCPAFPVRAVVAACCLLAAIGGCVAWTSPFDAASSPLNLPRMSRDTVVLEVAMLNVPAGETWDRDKLWREADEQRLPAEKRLMLADRGLRAGVIGTQLPKWISEKLEEQQGVVEFENKDGAAVLSNVETQQRLQCRAGRKRPVRLGETQDEMVLAAAPRETTDGDSDAENEENAEATEKSAAQDAAGEDSDSASAVVTDQPPPPATDGRIFKDAQCEVIVTAFPQGDGRVRVELTPQIRHGEPRRRWVAKQGSFHIDVGRECEVFEDLRMEVELEPGETLAIGATDAAAPLGQLLFGENSKAGFDRRVMLVRLAQTQLDDLFAPHDEATPIATLGQ